MTLQSKPTVLQTSEMPVGADVDLSRHFEVVGLGDVSPSANRSLLDRIEGIATTARGPVDLALIQRLPNLKIISCYSAGTDNIDVSAAGSRGIPVFTTSSLIGAEVANLAIGLLFALSRRMIEGDRYVRQGLWAAGPMPLGLSLADKRLGIVGMGNIGRQVAIRAQPFVAEIAYSGPNRKADAPYRYFAGVTELAEWCDFLVVCCPATASTAGIINAEVLAALGADGYLVNVARGSVVDEPALVDAIAGRQIAGAGLDVFAREPLVPSELCQSDRVVLLPHVGAATVEIRQAMGRAMTKALVDHIF